MVVSKSTYHRNMGEEKIIGGEEERMVRKKRSEVILKKMNIKEKNKHCNIQASSSLETRELKLGLDSTMHFNSQSVQCT